MDLAGARSVKVRGLYMAEASQPFMRTPMKRLFRCILTVGIWVSPLILWDKSAAMQALDWRHTKWAVVQTLEDLDELIVHGLTTPIVQEELAAAQRTRSSPSSRSSLTSKDKNMLRSIIQAVTDQPGPCGDPAGSVIEVKVKYEELFIAARVQLYGQTMGNCEVYVLKVDGHDWHVLDVRRFFV
jgi:hypothetical protein